MANPQLHILHTEASCGWGGQEIRILEEMRGMQERGHQVRLVCPAEAHIYRRAQERGLTVTALPIARKRLPGMLALRAWLKAQAVDVINTHSSTDSWLAALACASMPGAPAIVRTRHISAPIRDNRASRWLYGRATSHVVTTGEKLRETLIHENGLSEDHVTSVPTGIDTERFAPGDGAAARRALGLDPDCRWIGIVATLRSWKGHLYLLDALAALARSDVRLLIVGEGPMRENIEAHVAKLGLAKQVLLAGEQRNPEHWMRACDVFCLPSYANEGVPQALMQAMLCGLPVISTPVGAIAEIVADGATGVLVEPRNAAALAAAIARLLDDDRLARSMGAAARAAGEGRFSFGLMIDRMEAIFRAAARR
ncbi:MAG: glycosyltransferase family 4 protein [Rhodocyclaceae bacterium]|nr:glycosyltransferase family 4 protein [Rhodocyclaceae bacterium]MBX3669571.1 glycosyltransferase family 4 protein [Rhodocyclaceae bacterium]